MSDTPTLTTPDLPTTPGGADAPPPAARDTKKPFGPFSKKRLVIAAGGIVLCLVAWAFIPSHKTKTTFTSKASSDHARVAKDENTRAVAIHTSSNASPEAALNAALSPQTLELVKTQAANKPILMANSSQQPGTAFTTNTNPGAPLSSSAPPAMYASQSPQRNPTQTSPSFLSNPLSQPTNDSSLIPSSLIVYTRSTSTSPAPAQPSPSASSAASTHASTPPPSTAPPFAQQPPPPSQPAPPAQHNPSRTGSQDALNSSAGPGHKVFEGTMIDTVLTNRLDGTYSGPVNCMVTVALWSHDGQRILIPQGSRVLGETNRVSSAGQQRLAVVFHRIITPDGFSISLDQFKGMNQIGEIGLKDKVNNHYAQIFGVSLALGAISGLSSITSSGGGSNQTGSDRMQQGFAQATSMEATHILDRFLNILPTITIREGSRVKIYLTDDLTVPEYDNHSMSPSL